MPFSRSRSIESMTRSATSAPSRKAPDCQSIASTRVVLPWSTWATMATLRRSERVSRGTPAQARRSARAWLAGRCVVRRGLRSRERKPATPAALCHLAPTLPVLRDTATRRAANGTANAGPLPLARRRATPHPASDVRAQLRRHGLRRIAHVLGTLGQLVVVAGLRRVRPIARAQRAEDERQDPGHDEVRHQREERRVAV